MLASKCPSERLRATPKEVGRQARCIIAQPGHRKSPAEAGLFLATGLPKMRVNGNPRATIAWLGLAGRIVPAVNGVGVVGHGAINAAASLCK